MCELIRLAVAVTNEPDPREALAAVRAMRVELEDQLLVLAGRVLAGGGNWAEVGRALGVTRQGAHKHYAALVTRPPRRAHSGGRDTGPQVR